MVRLGQFCLVASILVGAGFAACSRTPEPTPSTTGAESHPPASATVAAHATASQTGAPAESSAAPSQPGSAMGATGSSGASPGPVPVLAWVAPTRWESVANTSPMRKATFKIPHAAGDKDDAELTVTSAGGGVKANVDRWAGQFAGATPRVTTRNVNDLKVTVVEIKGNYTGMAMGGATAQKSKQMLLGAIVDHGAIQDFFKMVGPEKTVKAAEPEFDKFVASLHAK